MYTLDEDTELLLRQNEPEAIKNLVWTCLYAPAERYKEFLRRGLDPNPGPIVGSYSVFFLDEAIDEYCDGLDQSGKEMYEYYDSENSRRLLEILTLCAFAGGRPEHFASGPPFDLPELRFLWLLP